MFTLNEIPRKQQEISVMIEERMGELVKEYQIIAKSPFHATRD
jgi:hypothetical protein